ncbi:sigma-70 family RNA polymerase sigma factor [Thauera sp. SDU_THAU2]|uniref:sigma-70 family RNA polymerase sigma factor n=1 Tax=Thauera sp. SDU_THAU2 TaxID=3136633 RepID=UPI004054B7B1
MAPVQPVADLYADHHHWLHVWLRKKLGCSEHAADLAHDTFLRLIDRDEPVELREPRAFLTTIAKGLVANHFRRQKIERAWLDALSSQPIPLSPSPEERALIVEALLRIDTLLDGLPPRVRSAFLLSQLEGLTYAEIAERQGVSVSMVKKYMLQAVTHCMQIELP